MKISYAITVCNEFVEIQRLVNFLVANKRPQDEIVIQFDSKGDSEIEAYLRSHSINGEFNWYSYDFESDFSKMKNRLTSTCTGDYIFQIDADEMPSTYMIDALPEILTHNDVDVFKVPRINTVQGITQQHIDTWKWGVNDKGWINFPDYQWRLYRNNNKVKWKNRVHEVLDGYKTMAYLPAEEQWCLRHDKTIEKQEIQNNLYNKIDQKDRYIIYAPPYDEKSGGITVLHKLCHELRQLGEEVYLYPMFSVHQQNTNPEWNTSFTTLLRKNDIVIYPEIVIGNPLNAKRVVRYLLNTPRPDEKQFGKDDFWLYHNKHFYNYAFDFSSKKTKLVREGEPENYLHFIEPRLDKFGDDGSERVGSCYTMRKGAEKGISIVHDLTNSREIVHNTSFSDLRKIFNTTKRFYCYDTNTYIATIAALCGCLSIVMPEDGIDKDQWRSKNPAMKYGIAYGEDDIDYALSTIDKVRPYLQELEQESKQQLITFINKSKNI